METNPFPNRRGLGGIHFPIRRGRGEVGGNRGVGPGDMRVWRLGGDPDPRGGHRGKKWFQTTVAGRRRSPPAIGGFVALSLHSGGSRNFASD